MKKRLSDEALDAKALRMDKKRKPKRVMPVRYSAVPAPSKGRVVLRTGR